MSASRWTDWRRWVATLCVVLAAFIMVEQSTSNDPCHGGQGSVSYNIADMIASVEQDGDNSTPQNSVPAQQHHCCSAHVAGMPPAILASALPQPLMLLKVTLDDQHAPTGEQTGQDRPPRLSFIA